MLSIAACGITQISLLSWRLTPEFRSEDRQVCGDPGRASWLMGEQMVLIRVGDSGGDVVVPRLPRCSVCRANHNRGYKSGWFDSCRLGAKVTRQQLRPGYRSRKRNELGPLESSESWDRPLALAHLVLAERTPSAFRGVS